MNIRPHSLTQPQFGKRPQLTPQVRAVVPSAVGTAVLSNAAQAGVVATLISLTLGTLMGGGLYYYNNHWKPNHGGNNQNRGQNDILG